MKPEPSHPLFAPNGDTQVYLTMLAEPQRSWTVAALADELPSVSVNSLRITLHLLLGDRLVDIVNAASTPSVLTLQLNDTGLQMLESAVKGIARRANTDEARSAGERTA